MFPSLWSIFILIFKIYYRIQAEDCKAQRGTDVTLICEVHSLPEFSTLQWDGLGASIPNTTLFLNNTAYIILHSVDQHSQGTYNCTLRQNEKKEIKKSVTLSVTKHTYLKKTSSLYRGSSITSDLLLICKSQVLYNRIMWSLKQQAVQGEVVLMAAEKGKKPNFTGAIKPGKHSSIFYDGQEFIFHISPVRFNYSGTYTCIGDDKTVYSRFKLHTVRVSAEPPHGAFRNQSVVLTCEVSEVTDQMTLAWLRMEGNRAVLVKQGVLTNRNSTKTLTLIPRNLSDEQRMWQCAVFTENKLRALAPLSIFAETPQQGGDVVEGTILYTVVIVGCAVVGCVVLLLGVLLFYCHRKSAAGAPSKEEKRLREDQRHSDSAYVNRDDGHVVAVKPVEEEEEELHYASVTVARVCHGEGRNCRKKAPATSDSTIYSTIKYH
ncbi:hypothetical protein AMEX_G14083 [Astyanax mexicanus]|uniref:Ig-like domain-containing protein n=1 Tax=Astyanax mexicanus TaxID=7994 RepID=A0A8T2LP88_ASTMX|nr:hypothetical protein AMEX_G14083 [Astyanax mexicanus]